MKRSNVGLTVFVLGLMAPLSALAKAPGEDAEFVTHAIRGDIGEMKIGTLAVQRGESAGVKDMGRMLSGDHEKSLGNATDVARGLGIQVPDQPLEAQQGAYQKLSQLTGSEFDRAFLKYAVTDHRKDIEEFGREAKQAKNPQVARFAGDSLPTLRKHLRMAQKLQAG